MIKAINLNTDEILIQHFNDKDFYIYGLEQGDNTYNNYTGNKIEDILDATSFGFNFIAINKNDYDLSEQPFINVNKIQLENVKDLNNEVELEV